MSENADQSTTTDGLQPHPSGAEPDPIVASDDGPDRETSRDPLETLKMKRTLHAFVHRLRG
jgi:hypothetical protein